MIFTLLWKWGSWSVPLSSWARRLLYYVNFCSLRSVSYSWSWVLPSYPSKSYSCEWVCPCPSRWILLWASLTTASLHARECRYGELYHWCSARSAVVLRPGCVCSCWTGSKGSVGTLSTFPRRAWRDSCWLDRGFTVSLPSVSWYLRYFQGNRSHVPAGLWLSPRLPWLSALSHRLLRTEESSSVWSCLRWCWR